MLSRAQKTRAETNKQLQDKIEKLNAEIEELKKELKQYKTWYDTQKTRIEQFEEMFAAIPEGYKYDPVEKQWDIENIEWHIKPEENTQPPSQVLEQKDDDTDEEYNTTALPPPGDDDALPVYDSEGDESSDGTSSDGSSNQGDDYNTAVWFNELMAYYTEALKPPASSQALLFPFKYGNLQKPIFLGDTLEVSGNTTITYYNAQEDEWEFNQELGSKVDPIAMANLIKSFGPSIVFVLVGTDDQLEELIKKVMLSPLPMGCDIAICEKIKKTLQNLVNIINGTRQTRYERLLDEDVDVLPSPLNRDEDPRPNTNPWLDDKKNYFLDLWVNFNPKEKFNLSAYLEHYNSNPEEVTNMWRDFYNGYWQHYRDTWSDRYPVTITDWVEHIKWRVNELTDADMAYSVGKGLDWDKRTLVADPYADVVSMNYGPYSLLSLLYDFKKDINKFWDSKQLLSLFKAGVNEGEGKVVLGSFPPVVTNFFVLDDDNLEIQGEQWSYIRKMNDSLKFGVFGLFPSTEIETNSKFASSNQSVFELVKDIKYINIIQSLRVPSPRDAGNIKDIVELKRQIKNSLMDLRWELSDEQKTLADRGRLGNCPLTWVGRNDKKDDFQMKINEYNKWKKEKEAWLNTPERQSSMKKAYGTYIKEVFKRMKVQDAVNINGYTFADVEQLEKFAMERGSGLDVLFGECVDLVMDDLVN